VNGLAVRDDACALFLRRQMSLPLPPIRANKIRDGLWSSVEYGESGWAVAFFAGGMVLIQFCFAMGTASAGSMAG